MPALAFAELEWQSAPMRGSNGAVALARLPDLGDGAFRAFVRFPAGWSRPGAGHYAVAEQFLVLGGDLTLDERTWNAGGYAWIPARRVRKGSRSIAGCLAFAWFGGPPRWVAGVAVVPVGDTDVHFTHWREAPERDLGGGLLARALRAGQAHDTWLIERPGPGHSIMFGASCETLRLTDHHWTWQEPLEARAELAAPILVRTRQGCLASTP